MSKTIDITLEKTGTSVDVEYQDNLQNEILVSLSRGTGVEVDNVAPFITVDFGSLPQNVYWDEIQDKPSFHPVATSGDYDDLENKPDLHPVATSGDYDDLENKPNLSNVATSGNYGDLNGKPSINGVTLSGNKTTSDLGLASASQGALAESAYQKPSDGIPASDMTAAVQDSLRKADTALQEHQSLEGYATESWVEDQGYLTEHQDISGKADKSDTYTKQEVDAKMASAMHYKGSVANYDALLLIQDAEVGDMYNVLDTGHNYAWDGAAWDIQSGIVDLSGKQDTLVSGENIKTINGESVLGSGNLVIEGGGGTGDYEDLDNLPSINNVELIGNKTAAQLGLQPTLTIDETPTEGSTNPVQSGGVYSALQQKPTIFFTPDIMNVPPTILNKVKVGDVIQYGDDAVTEVTVAVKDEQSDIVILAYNDGMNVAGFQYQNGVCIDTISFGLTDMATKVSGATNGNLAGLAANGDLTDSGIAASDVATTSDLAGKQDTISDLATIRSGAALGATALQSYTETDPTVPSWAKQSTKPSYDYSEIGNTPDLSGFITKSVNDLTNYYLKSETYTKTEVANLIAAINQFHYEIDASTSAVTTPESNVLYLIGPIGSGTDKYEEYVYPDSTTGWVKIGDTSIDLSGYVTTSALNTTLAGYQTKIDSSHKLDYSLLDNTPTIPTVPTNVSAFNNDAGYLTEHQDISDKADKVENATSGNFAGLDSNGNITDSGSKASDFATAAQGALAATAIQGVSVNGTPLTPSSGVVSVQVPTSTSDITNDSGFVNTATDELLYYYKKSQTYSQAEVDALLASVNTFEYVSVDTLPTASSSTVGKVYIYNGHRYITEEDGGSYDWIDLGSYDIDLSGYVTTAALNTALEHRPIFQEVTETQMQNLLDNGTWEAGVLYYSVEQEEQ